MHRMDRRTQEEKDSRSVGVCHGCGAGICVAHARITPRTVRHRFPRGSSAQARARTVSCAVCAQTGALSAAASAL